MQAHLGADPAPGFGQEVGCPHPRLDGAEGMLDRFPAHGHDVRVLIEPQLHGIEHRLMFPAFDPAFLGWRAERLYGASLAGGRVPIAIGPSILRARGMPHKPLAAGAEIFIGLGQKAKVLFAVAACRLAARRQRLGNIN